MSKAPKSKHAYPLPGVTEWPVRFGHSGYIVRYLVERDTVTASASTTRAKTGRPDPFHKVDLADPIRYRLLARATEFQP